MKPGEHTLKITVSSKIANHGGIDCMCFVNFAWSPAGTRSRSRRQRARTRAAEERPRPWRSQAGANTCGSRANRPRQHTFKKHGWYDGVNKSLLSGGDWLSHYANEAPGEATYRFTVKQGGKYTWWLRCNTVQMTQHYRLDGKPKVEMDLTSDVRGQLNLVDRPDHRFIGWVKGGPVRPGGGRAFDRHQYLVEDRQPRRDRLHVFRELRLGPLGHREAAAGDRRVARGPDTWFDVLPDDDPFSEQSIIDMSRLLHTPAGKFGFVQRRGADFVFSESGQKIKFWGIVAAMTTAEPLRDQQARLYAKHGINMVRQHPVEAVVGLLQRDPATGQRTFDPAAAGPPGTAGSRRSRSTAST